MLSNRVFQITLLISLITHGIVLFQNSNLNLFPNNKKEEKLEVSYIKEPKKQPELPKKDVLSRKELFLKLPSTVMAKKKMPPPFMDIDKENIFNKSRESALQGPAFTKPIFIKPDIIAIKKKITLPPVDIDKIKNPSYLSYYQTVREKIRRAAYQNYTRAEVGEVYLSFIISYDGYLKETRLIEEKSSSSFYLKEIALRSIRDASPFPNFPKDLNYPRLSFNVIISFEIE